jgi:ectoine hydroxylase-related dioxygenase (phytanoyl-CoA dioxygenase family)
MTTYPEGYLVAMWIAFEDIHPGSGPLEYYPGSHRFRAVHSVNVGIGDDAFKQSGYQEFDLKYTSAIKKIISGRALKPHHFCARKGDVLFWHANLLHGGSARRDYVRTRKALVFHFFADGCICYHDLASTPSRVHAAGAARAEPKMVASSFVAPRR